MPHPTFSSSLSEYSLLLDGGSTCCVYLSQALLGVLLDEIIDRFAKGFGPVADALFHQLKPFVEFQSPLPECRLAAILYSTYFYYSHGHDTDLAFVPPIQDRADGGPNSCTRNTIEEAQESGEGA